MAKRSIYPDVTPERFIQVWQTCETAEDVARELKMPKPIVLARATNYRQAGVRLKSMKRKRKGLDVEAMNQFIARLTGGSTPEASPQARAVVPDEEKNADMLRRVLDSLHS